MIIRPASRSPRLVVVLDVCNGVSSLLSVRCGYLKAVKLNWETVVLDGRLVQLLGQQQTGVVRRYCA